jgi:hypothetical protein
MLQNTTINKSVPIVKSISFVQKISGNTNVYRKQGYSEMFVFFIKGDVEHLLCYWWTNGITGQVITVTQ